MIPLLSFTYIYILWPNEVIPIRKGLYHKICNQNKERLKHHQNDGHKKNAPKNPLYPVQDPCTVCNWLCVWPTDSVCHTLVSCRSCTEWRCGNCVQQKLLGTSLTLLAWRKDTRLPKSKSYPHVFWEPQMPLPDKVRRMF